MHCDNQESPIACVKLQTTAYSFYLLSKSNTRQTNEFQTDRLGIYLDTPKTLKTES